MNSRRVRNPRSVDPDALSDGFWSHGYGNDPRRRRIVRRKEKQDLRRQVEVEAELSADLL